MCYMTLRLEQPNGPLKRSLKNLKQNEKTSKRHQPGHHQRDDADYGLPVYFSFVSLLHPIPLRSPEELNLICRLSIAHGAQPFNKILTLPKENFLNESSGKKA